MKLITLLIVCLSFISLRASSQEYSFSSINEMFGISMREITSVIQDSDGFIWAASHTGILRVAADEYKQYELPFVAADVLQVKLAYRNGKLVAVTQNGQVFLYNRIYDKFELWFTLAPQLGNDGWVTNLQIDADNKVWIGTSSGVYVRHGDEMVALFAEQGEFSHLTLLDGNSLLVFTQSAIYRLDTKTYASTRLQGRMPSSISATRYDERMDLVWVGTHSAGMWSYDLKTQRFQEVKIPSFPQFAVRDILVTDGAFVWIAVDGDGIWILDKQTCQVQRVLREDLDNPSSLHGNCVYALLVDKYNRLWTATNSGGLQYTVFASSAVEHLSHKINNPFSLHSNEINALLTDAEGNLWVATQDGIGKRSARTHEWKRFFAGSQQIFLSLAADKKGRIYAGTYGKGLYILDSTGKKLHHFTDRDGKLFGSGSLVFASFTDSQGDVWLGGVKDSVYCCQSATGKLTAYTPQPVNCFAEYQPGQILLGCLYGLLLLDKQTGRFDVLLSNYNVHDIVVEDKMIWIATSSKGVLGLDMKSGQLEQITVRQGLLSNYTRSLFLSDKLLWIGTDRGLCRLDLTDRRIKTFVAQSLLSNTSFSRNAKVQLPDGRLAFGSSQGVVLFQPSKLISSHSSGRIYFSDISISGRSVRDIPEMTLTEPVDSFSTLKLKYPQNSFTLSIFPLGQISKSARLSWKLVGQDKNWTENTSNRYINYTNLPAGNYTLCIQLYDEELLAERQLRVVIEPPFWETVWFDFLVVIFIAVLVFMVARFHAHRLHRRYADEKIRFFTRMAHDIRSSLMLIKAPIDELQKEDHLTSWGKKCLTLASEQTKRLSDTATQLLDFEKLDIGCEQPLFARVNLTDLVRRRVAIYEAYAASKQISLSAEYLSEDLWVAADARMIERIVDNLLSNAVKYSLAGGQILMKLTSGTEDWKLVVKDNGIGISKSAQRKLFQEFYRSENAVNAQIIGSGIGLLMTYRYVNIHRGRILVTSELNQGATFEIIIPIHPVSEDQMVETVKSEVMEIPEQETADVHDMHVLVVEDNQALRDFMVYPLRERFHVTVASDGQQAWDMIQAQQPDLVVSDVLMPHMNGFELCKRIKSTYETSHIPVILLTALSDQASQLHGLDLGADNYLTKPFDMDLLSSRIMSIISNRRTVFQKAIENKRAEERSVVVNQMNDEFIQKAVACVRANMNNEHFGKEEFASALALSQSLLYKKIKALTNLTVVEFIREIRLNYAMELLQSGKYNVTEVSEKCGFTTSAYFCKVFKDFFGKTPTEVM